MNYFKILRSAGIVVAFLVLTALFGFSLYVKTQEHNLNVLTQIMNCTKNFGPQYAEKCAQTAKPVFIPPQK